MRCQNCNKFVSVDAEADPDVAGCDINNGVVEIEVRIVNLCEECGDELSEYTFNIEHEVEHEHLDQLDVDEGSCVRTEATRRGRKYYGFSLTVIVTCNEPECNFREEIEIEDAVPASDMEEI